MKVNNKDIQIEGVIDENDEENGVEDQESQRRVINVNKMPHLQSNKNQNKRNEDVSENKDSQIIIKPTSWSRRRYQNEFNSKSNIKP